MYIMDNSDIYNFYENEQVRFDRMEKRIEHEEQKESELPWVTVPNDYGTHPELYAEGGKEDVDR